LLFKAVSQWPALGNAGRLAELLWLGAQAYGSIGQDVGAARMLRSLCEVAAVFTIKLALVQGLSELIFHQRNELARVTRARKMATRMGMPAPTIEGLCRQESGIQAEISSAQARLAQALDQLSTSDVDRERSMIRLAIVRLGPDYPETIARIALWVVSDFADVMSKRWDALVHVIDKIHDFLKSINDSAAITLASRVIEQPSHAGPELCDGLLTLISSGHRERPLMAALLALLALEDTNLVASTLAGIEAYRDDFELGSSSDEVMA
jgi:hypothetical protein